MQLSIFVEKNYCNNENKLDFYWRSMFVSGVQFQKKTICVVICAIWLYACLWAAFPLLGWGSYGPEPFGTACSIDWTGYGDSLNNATFIVAMSVLCTFLPCLVIFFTYFGIAWKLHKAYKSIKSSDFQYASVERRITLVRKLRVD